MAKKLNLTFITAVLNQEKELPLLYKEIKGFIKQGEKWIVAVDYRTKDRSLIVARNLGARVLIDKGESKGIVFLNKNKGVERANTD